MCPGEARQPRGLGPFHDRSPAAGQPDQKLGIGRTETAAPAVVTVGRPRSFGSLGPGGGRGRSRRPQLTAKVSLQLENRTADAGLGSGPSGLRTFSAVSDQAAANASSSTGVGWSLTLRCVCGYSCPRTPRGHLEKAFYVPGDRGVSQEAPRSICAWRLPISMPWSHGEQAGALVYENQLSKLATPL